MVNQDFIKYHLHEAIYAAAAEADGDEDLSRQLHAGTKSRLISMTDDELWELAKLTAFPPKLPVELAYKRYKQKIEELKATASEWMKDLVNRTDKGEVMTSSILIIASETISRSQISAALTEASFMVVDVPNFPEALLKLNEFKPDVVIMDAVLPGRDGMEACYQLHSTFGIPVILLGEDSGDEVWERVMEADADLYLVKPFSYAELVARVKAILRRYRRQEAPRYQNEQ